MGYTFGASVFDTLLGQGAAAVASGAAPELRNAVVGAVQQVLPQLKTTLSSALSEGLSTATKENRNVFIVFGAAMGLFTVGTLTLLMLQYRRAGKCCPIGVR